MFSGCFGPTRAHRQEQCVCIVGPCEWLQVNVFRLLWANSSSSARAVCLHRGPMRVAAALGQLELIGKGSVFASRAHASVCRLLWANSSSSARAVCSHRGPMRMVAGECFRAALGQLELIGKGSVFAPWARASGCR